MARKLVPFALGTLALLLLLAPTASAASVSLTIVAQEGDCSAGSFCLEVTEGDASSVAPGDEVTVTFQNEGSSTHNLYVAASDDANPGENTPASAALENTDDVSAGNSTTLTFTAPADASGVYYWCDVGGHEQLGMYINQEYEGGNGGGNGGGDGGGSPMPAWTMLVAFAAVSLALARRRRA